MFASDIQMEYPGNMKFSYFMLAYISLIKIHRKIKYWKYSMTFLKVCPHPCLELLSVLIECREYNPLQICVTDKAKNRKMLCCYQVEKFEETVDSLEKYSIMNNFLTPKVNNLAELKKNVYFLGSWPVFPQFVMCFCVQKDKISLRIPKFPSNH